MVQVSMFRVWVHKILWLSLLTFSMIKAFHPITKLTTNNIQLADHTNSTNALSRFSTCNNGKVYLNPKIIGTVFVFDLISKLKSATSLRILPTTICKVARKKQANSA